MFINWYHSSYDIPLMIAINAKMGEYLFKYGNDWVEFGVVIDTGSNVICLHTELYKNLLKP